MPRRRRRSSMLSKLQEGLPPPLKSKTHGETTKLRKD
jgi:hypothetical protein